MNKDFCYNHPKHVLVGVCPFCLNQKLLLVVATQKSRRSSQEDGGGRKKAAGNIVGLPAKIFALGSRWRSYNVCDDGGSDPSSLEDSFISIKFEDNGVALWDNNKVGKASQEQSTKPCGAATTTVVVGGTDHMGLTKDGSWRSGGNNSVVEHAKATRVSLMWRKRIAHLLQLVKWKRSKKGIGGASHVEDGAVKVRSRGWIKELTSRKTKE